jgi:hypothetical protein
MVHTYHARDDGPGQKVRHYLQNNQYKKSLSLASSSREPASKCVSPSSNPSTTKKQKIIRISPENVSVYTFNMLEYTVKKIISKLKRIFFIIQSFRKASQRFRLKRKITARVDVRERARK